MKLFLHLVTVMLALATANADSKKRSLIQWKPYDCSNPLTLPEQQFEVSQFAKGKYRVDGGMSEGHFNCIYIIFQAANSLESASVQEALESTFTIKGQKVTWRRYKTVIEGRPIIRQEALLPNILPHQKQGSDSDYIWLRIDADSQKIIDQLTPVAEAILQDAA